MRKKNILVIGSGSIAQRHIRNINKKNFFDIDLYSKSLHQQNMIKKKFSNLNIINKKSMKKNYDYMIFANASHSRYKYFNTFYNQSSKIYFEKPLACSIQESKKLKKKKKQNF